MSTVNFNPRDRIDLNTTSADGALVRVRLMARSGGYVMVRKPGRAPFVMSEKQWAKLPLFDAGRSALNAPAADREGRRDRT